MTAVALASLPRHRNNAQTNQSVRRFFWIPRSLARSLADPPDPERLILLETVRRITSCKAQAAAISTRLLDHLVGCRRRARISQYLQYSGFFRVVREYLPGSQCRAYELAIRDIAPGIPILKAGQRCRGWIAVEVTQEHLDLIEDIKDGLQDLGYNAAAERQSEALESLAMPHIDHAEIAAFAASQAPSKAQSADELSQSYREILDRIADNPTGAKLANGRIYCAWQQLPRAWRSKIRMWCDGRLEQTCEVDISSCWWFVLAASVPDKDEARRLLELINSGRFYETLAGDRIGEFSSRAELKVATNKHCLFSRQISDHWLWRRLQAMAPGLCELIMSYRSQRRGRTRLAHSLQRAEFAIMGRVQDQLAEEGVPYMSLHDGIRVPRSASELTAELIRLAAVEAYGTAPNVSQD